MEDMSCHYHEWQNKYLHGFIEGKLVSTDEAVNLGHLKHFYRHKSFESLKQQIKKETNLPRSSNFGHPSTCSRAKLKANSFILKDQRAKDRAENVTVLMIFWGYTEGFYPTKLAKKKQGAWLLIEPHWTSESNRASAKVGRKTMSH